jgi:hypothetical protein
MTDRVGILFRSFSMCATSDEQVWHHFTPARPGHRQETARSILNRFSARSDPSAVSGNPAEVTLKPVVVDVEAVLIFFQVRVLRAGVIPNEHLESAQGSALPASRGPHSNNPALQ